MYLRWDIVEHTRQRVDAFRRTLPLLGDLKNPAMRKRHWDKVRKIMDKDFDENAPEFNLEAIYAMQMHVYAEDINEISNAATMELQIEKGLEAISLVWKTMAIEVVPHKERGVYRYGFIFSNNFSSKVQNTVHQCHCTSMFNSN